MSNLPNTIATLFELSINRYLALDSSSQESVAALENKTITLVLKEFSFPLYYKIEKSRIKVVSDFETETDVQIATSIPALIKMTMSEKSEESVLGSDIDMSGNMDVGRAFRDIFRNVDIDWEELISRYTGDIIAHKLGNGYRQFSHWLSGAGRTIESDITEYLQEESRQLPSNVEVASFLNGVDDARLAVDRAEARLRMLSSTIEKKHASSSTENN